MKIRNYITTILLTLATLLSARAEEPTYITRYVTVDGRFNNSGTSWTESRNNIQDAINELSKYIEDNYPHQSNVKGRVFVGAGTYYPTESTEEGLDGILYTSFKILPNIEVYGGFTATGQKYRQVDGLFEGWFGSDNTAYTPDGDNFVNSWGVVYVPVGEGLYAREVTIYHDTTKDKYYLASNSYWMEGGYLVNNNGNKYEPVGDGTYKQVVETTINFVNGKYRDEFGLEYTTNDDGATLKNEDYDIQYIRIGDATSTTYRLVTDEVIDLGLTHDTANDRYYNESDAFSTEGDVLAQYTSTGEPDKYTSSEKITIKKVSYEYVDGQYQTEPGERYMRNGLTQSENESTDNNSEDGVVREKPWFFHPSCETRLSGDHSKRNNRFLTWNSDKQTYDESYPSSSYHVVWFGTNGYYTAADLDAGNPYTDIEEQRCKPFADGATARVDGFTIVGGNASNRTIASRRHTSFGGGVYMVDGAFLTNCQVSQNSAARSGGGVYLDGGGEVQSCYIYQNQALGIGITDGYGGGVAVDHYGAVLQSAITDNCGRIGAGLSVVMNNETYPNGMPYNPRIPHDGYSNYVFYQSPLAAGCVIANNTATTDGGGVLLKNGGLLNLCTVVRNHTAGSLVVSEGHRSGRSGGVYVDVGGFIFNSVLWGNTTRHNGTTEYATYVPTSTDGLQDGLKPYFYFSAISNHDNSDWTGTQKDGVVPLEAENNRPTTSRSSKLNYAEFLYIGEDSNPSVAGVETSVNNSPEANDGDPFTTVRTPDWTPHSYSSLVSKGISLRDYMTTRSDKRVLRGVLTKDIRGNRYSARSVLGAYIAKPMTVVPAADVESIENAGEDVLTIFVDPEARVSVSSLGEEDASRGNSWDNPLVYLNDALDYIRRQMMATTPYQILVKEGTMAMSNRNLNDAAIEDANTKRLRDLTYDIPGNVRIYGGFHGDLSGTEIEDLEVTPGNHVAARNPLLYPTKMDGSFSELDYSLNVAHVATIHGSNVVLDGFKIYGGNTADSPRLIEAWAPRHFRSYDDSWTGDLYQHNGAGILIEDADNVVLRNILIADCTAEGGQGAAIYAENSTVKAENLIVHNNASHPNGDATPAAVYAVNCSGSGDDKGLEIDHALLRGNVGGLGADASSVVLNNSALHANVAADKEGAKVEEDFTATTEGIVAFLAENGATFEGDHNLVDNNDGITLPTGLTAEKKLTYKLSDNDDFTYPRFKNPTSAVGVRTSAEQTLNFGNVTIYGGDADWTPNNMNPMVNAASTADGLDFTQVTTRNHGGAADIGAIENPTLPLSGRVKYVRMPKDGGSDDNDGNSWATAYATIQKALDELSTVPREDGDENPQVWVAAGTYENELNYKGGSQFQGEYGGKRRWWWPLYYKYIDLKDGIDILGGFVATGNPGNILGDPAKDTGVERNISNQYPEYATVIQGSTKPVEVTWDASATQDADAPKEGLATPPAVAVERVKARYEQENETLYGDKKWGMTRKKADEWAREYFDYYYMTYAPGLVQKADFTHHTIYEGLTVQKFYYSTGWIDNVNTAEMSGYMWKEMNPGGTLVIDNEHARYQGVGVNLRNNAELRNCLVRDNVLYNHASSIDSEGGGGIHIQGDNALIKNSIIRDNMCISSRYTTSAGIYLRGGTLINSLVVENTCLAYNNILGAAVYGANKGRFYNCTIANNRADMRTTSTGSNAVSPGVWDATGNVTGYDDLVESAATPADFEEKTGHSLFYNCLFWGNEGNGATAENYYQVCKAGYTGNTGKSNRNFFNCFQSTALRNTSCDQIAAGKYENDRVLLVIYDKNKDNGTFSIDESKKEAALRYYTDKLAYDGTSFRTDCDSYNLFLKDDKGNITYQVNPEAANLFSHIVNMGDTRYGAVLKDSYDIDVDIMGADRIQDCTIDKGAYEYDGTVDIRPSYYADAEETTPLTDAEGAVKAVFFVNEVGHGTAAADKDNMACSQKLQKVLDAAGRCKYAHPDLDVEVRLAAIESDPGNPDKETAYLPSREVMHYDDATLRHNASSENPRAFSLLVPRGITLAGGYTSDFTARNIGTNRTYLAGHYTQGTQNVDCYHTLAFTRLVYGTDGQPMPAVEGDESFVTVEVVGGAGAVNKKYRVIPDRKTAAPMDRAVVDGLFIIGGNADGSDDAAPAVADISYAKLDKYFPDNYGGAAIVPSYAHIRNCVVENNKAMAGGGALLLKPRALVSGSIFRNNSTDGSGGAIFVWEPDGWTSGTTLMPDDSAPQPNEGGNPPIYGSDYPFAQVFTSTIVGNHAQRGGGLSFTHNLRLNSSVLWQNTANSNANINGNLDPNSATVSEAAPWKYPLTYTALENLQAPGYNNVSVNTASRLGVRWDYTTATSSAFADDWTDESLIADRSFLYDLMGYSLLTRHGMPMDDWNYISNPASIGYFPSLESADLAGTLRTGVAENAYIEIGARAFGEAVLKTGQLLTRLFVAKPEDTDLDATVALMNSGDPIYSQMGSSMAYPFNYLDDALDYIRSKRKEAYDNYHKSGASEAEKNDAQAVADTRFEVFISRGTYIPYKTVRGVASNTRANTFLLPEGVSVYGGVQPDVYYSQDTTDGAVFVDPTEVDITATLSTSADEVTKLVDGTSFDITSSNADHKFQGTGTCTVHKVASDGSLGTSLTTGHIDAVTEAGHVTLRFETPQSEPGTYVLRFAEGRLSLKGTDQPVVGAFDVLIKVSGYIDITANWNYPMDSGGTTGNANSGATIAKTNVTTNSTDINLSYSPEIGSTEASAPKSITITSSTAIFWSGTSALSLYKFNYDTNRFATLSGYTYSRTPNDLSTSSTTPTLTGSSTSMPSDPGIYGVRIAGSGLRLNSSYPYYYLNTNNPWWLWYYVAPTYKTESDISGFKAPELVVPNVHMVATVPLISASTMTIATHRPRYDVNQNGIVEAWGLEHQTILSGNVVNSDATDNVFHVLMAVPAEEYVGLLPTPSHSRAETWDGSYYKERGQTIILDGLQITEGQARKYDPTMTSLSTFYKGGALCVDGNWYSTKDAEGNFVDYHRELGLIDTSKDFNTEYYRVKRVAGYRDIPVLMRGCLVYNNEACHGGALYSNGEVQIYQSKFAQNRATEDTDILDLSELGQSANASVTHYGRGGAADVAFMLMAVNSSFDNNTCTGGVGSALSPSGVGGAISIGDLGTIEMMNCNVVRNEARSYPAIYLFAPNKGFTATPEADNPHRITNSIFWGNRSIGKPNPGPVENYVVNPAGDDADNAKETIWFSAYEPGTWLEAHTGDDLYQLNADDVHRDVDFRKTPSDMAEAIRMYIPKKFEEMYANPEAKKTSLQTRLASVGADYSTSSDLLRTTLKRQLNQQIAYVDNNIGWTLHNSTGTVEIKNYNFNIHINTDNNAIDGPNFINPTTTPGTAGYNPSADWMIGRINNIVDRGWTYLEQKFLEDKSVVFFKDYDEETGAATPSVDYYGAGNYYTLKERLFTSEQLDSHDYGSLQENMPLFAYPYMYYASPTREAKSIQRVSYDPNPTHLQSYIDMGMYEYQHAELAITTTGDIDIIWVTANESVNAQGNDGSSKTRATTDLQRAIETLLASRNDHHKEVRLITGSYMPVYTLSNNLAFTVNTSYLDQSVIRPEGDGYHGVQSLTLRGGYSPEGLEAYDVDRYPTYLYMAHRTGAADNVLQHLFIVDDARQRETLATTGATRTQDKVIPITLEGLTFVNQLATNHDDPEIGANGGAAIFYKPQLKSGEGEDGSELDAPADGSPKLTIKNCTFMLNGDTSDANAALVPAVTIARGGGRSLIYNSQFHHNTGNAIDAVATDMLNCTVALNGGKVKLDEASGLYNSLLWRNAAGEYEGSFAMTHNAITGFTADANDNESLDGDNTDVINGPNFIAPVGFEAVDPETGDTYTEWDFSILPSAKTSNKASALTYVQKVFTASEISATVDYAVNDEASAIRFLADGYDKYDAIEKAGSVAPEGSDDSMKEHEPLFNKFRDAGNKIRLFDTGMERGAFEGDVLLTRVLYLRPTLSAADDHTGESWELAYGSSQLQKAIDACAVYNTANDKKAYVFVKGEYSGVGDNARAVNLGDITLRNGVELYGSIPTGYNLQHDDARFAVADNEDATIENYIVDLRNYPSRTLAAPGSQPSRVASVTAVESGMTALIDGFDIAPRDADADRTAVTTGADVASVALRNCIVHNFSTTDSPIVDLKGGALMYNSLVRDISVANASTPVVKVADGSYMLNCTVAAPQVTGQALIESVPGVGDMLGNSINNVEYAFAGADINDPLNEATSPFAPYYQYKPDFYYQSDTRFANLNRYKNLWYQLAEESNYLETGRILKENDGEAYRANVPAAAQALFLAYVNFRKDRDLLGNPRVTNFGPDGVYTTGRYIDMGCFETWTTGNPAAHQGGDPSETVINPKRNPDWYGGNYYPHPGSVVYIQPGGTMILGATGTDPDTYNFTKDNPLRPGFTLVREGGSIYTQGNSLALSYVALQKEFTSRYAMLAMPFRFKLFMANDGTDDYYATMARVVYPGDDPGIEGSKFKLGDIGIYAYDGSRRAGSDYKFAASDSPCWTPIAPGSVINPDNGWLLDFGEANTPSEANPVKVRFNAYGDSDNDYVYVEGVINEAAAGGTVVSVDHTNKQVVLTQHDSRDASNGAPVFTHEYNMGWNLVGMPYLVTSYPTASDSRYLMNIPHIVYKLQPDGTYTTMQSWAAGAELAIGEAYFTQTAVKGTEEPLTFASPEYHAPVTPSDLPMLCLARGADAASTDGLLTVFPAEAQGTLAYTLGNDGAWFAPIKSDAAQIYAIGDESLRLSLLSAAPIDVEIPLGISAPQGAELSFRLPSTEAWTDDYDVQGVWLLDTQNGSAVNLLEADYNTTLDKDEQGDCIGRFYLRLGNRPEADFAEPRYDVQGRDGHIRIAGLQPGDAISIFTVKGIVVRTATARGELETFDVDPDEVYVVRINTYATKLLM